MAMYELYVPAKDFITWGAKMLVEASADSTPELVPARAGLVVVPTPEPTICVFTLQAIGLSELTTAEPMNPLGSPGGVDGVK